MRSPTAGASIEKSSYNWSLGHITTVKGQEDEEPGNESKKQQSRGGRHDSVIHMSINVLKLMSDLSIWPATD